LVARVRSAKTTSLADWSRSRSTGALNLPTRTANAGETFTSVYASKSTVCPWPKSGMSRISRYFPMVASRIGRARRRKKVLVTGTALSERKNRPSVCTTPLNRTAYFPSADLMVKPSFAPAVADTLSLDAALMLSASSSRSR